MSINHIYSQTSNYNWQDKLEELRSKKSQAPSENKELSDQEGLNVVSYLAFRNVSHLFKNPPIFKITTDIGRSLISQGEGKKGKELYAFISQLFLTLISSLSSLLHVSTQKILLLDSVKDIKEFQLIHKQIRSVFLFLMSNESRKNSYCNKYKEYLVSSWGNREWGAAFCPKPPCYYYYDLFPRNEPGADLNKYEEFQQLVNKFSIFHRHYRLRLHSEKITQRSQCKNEETLTLLSGTWFHGTRALTMLEQSDFTLIPTGWLRQLGFVPFFGEIQAGCEVDGVMDGVNASQLSGTYLDRIDWVMDSYAVGFQFSIDNEIQLIADFLKWEDSFRNFTSESAKFPRFQAALQRLALWDAALFQAKIPELCAKVAYLKECIESIEKARPDEIYAYHDNTYSAPFKSIVYSINQIHDFLSSPFQIPLSSEQKERIMNNFPVVLGSTTLISRHFSYADYTGEHLVYGTATIGTDLQFLCVQEENLERAKEYMRTTLPSANIRFFSFTQLHEARAVNKIISPYLADIFSLNKFNQLCPDADKEQIFLIEM